MTSTPPENPSTWSPEAQAFFGHEFTRIVDEGTAIYNEYTTDEIQSDPSLAIELARRSNTQRNQSCRIGSERFIQYLFKHERARRDPFTAFNRVNGLILSAFPEWNTGDASAANFFLTQITNSMRSQAMARFAMWRHRNNNPGRYEYILYRTLGTEYNENRIRELERRDPASLMVMRSYFEYLNIENFLRTNGIAPREDERNIFAPQRRRINDEIARIISENRQFGIPLSIRENKDLARELIDIQFDGIDPQHSEHPLFKALIIIYNHDQGQIVKNEPNLMERSRPTSHAAANPADTSHCSNRREFIVGSVPLLMTRDGGEISGFHADAEGLRFYFGAEIYELLRTHLLLQLAELTCEARGLREALQGLIDLPEIPPSQPRGPRGPGNEPGNRGSRRVLPSRYFPRISHESVESDTDNQRIIRRHGVNFHPRWLPLGHFPSRRALELARDNDLPLETQTYADGSIRYQTFVQEHKRGRPDPILTPQNEVLAVQQESRINLVEALNHTRLNRR